MISTIVKNYLRETCGAIFVPTLPTIACRTYGKKYTLSKATEKLSQSALRFSIFLQVVDENGLLKISPFGHDGSYHSHF